MRVWAPVGQTPTVRVDTQRDMIHFYGSLNLSTGEETVIKAETINSETTALFLAQVAQCYPDKPILLLWDRATWHSGKRLRTFLQLIRESK